jgi:hypothetical protein
MMNIGFTHVNLVSYNYWYAYVFSYKILLPNSKYSTHKVALFIKKKKQKRLHEWTFFEMSVLF